MKTVWTRRTVIVLFGLLAMFSQGCTSIIDEDEAWEHKWAEYTTTLTAECDRLKTNAWDRFQQEENESNKLDAAFVICSRLAVHDEKDRRKLVQFCKRVLEQEKGQHSKRISEANLCLAMLGAMDSGTGVVLQDKNQDIKPDVSTKCSELWDELLSFQRTLWDVFKKESGPKRLIAAEAICGYFPVHAEKEKQKMVQFLRHVGKTNGNSSEQEYEAGANLYLALLGETDAEMRLFDELAKQREEDEERRLHPPKGFMSGMDGWRFLPSYAEDYLDVRGGNLYLVSVLKSSQAKELRRKAWKLLSGLGGLSLPKDIDYDPSKDASEQSAALDRLSRFVEESEKGQTRDTPHPLHPHPSLDSSAPLSCLRCLAPEGDTLD